MMLNGFTPQEEHKLRVVKINHGMQTVGYCYRCGDWVLRRDVRQEERDETCVYVCQRDGSIIDEHPPFA